MATDHNENVTGTLLDWEPTKLLRSVPPFEAKLSRGFLRSRPERWFPGFGVQWLALAHSLGLEMRITEVKPVLSAPRGLDTGFAGTVDDEPIGMFMDAQSTRVLLEAVVPGAGGEARNLALEYLARRLLGSLALAWSGPESSVVQFDTQINPKDVREGAAVKISVSINGSQCVLWVLIGKLLVERMDGLWKRQVHSTVKGDGKAATVHYEIAQLAVPPSLLAEYTRRGAEIDLEVAASDTITLRVQNEPWMQAKLCIVGGHFGIEIQPGPPIVPTVEEGSTRLGIELGFGSLEPLVMAELSQIGAIYETDIPVGTTVQLMINNEKVCDADLALYEGRFAVRVK